MKNGLLAAAALVIVAGSAQAADAAKGEKLAQAQCAACHGRDFVTPVDPGYPRLAGQYPDYLEKALREYQTGGRKNPIMAGIAKPLSRADISDLAAYLSGLPGPLDNTKR
ncbi:MAG TPA: cytochrome c [Burkholderiaceae bacterium]|nr:cytochrome c [Burkholderiaceae bacterium]